MKLLTTDEIIKKYGQPGDTKNFTVIPLPYPMRVAWDLKVSISKMQCHKLVAANFSAVFAELLQHYGYEKIQELEIDIFGGSYNFRKIRNGKGWSTHSWGIAADFSTEKNGLKTKWKDAQFSKPEYIPMIEIFYKHGFVNLGLEWGKDAMHFQIGS